jgi:hypothetical protein
VLGRPTHASAQLNVERTIYIINSSQLIRLTVFYTRYIQSAQRGGI